MPSNLSFLDTNFPAFTDEDSTEKKIDTIQDYLYMTVESLRYALSHLNEGNMEQNFVDSIVTGSGSLAEIKQTVADHSASILLLSQVQTEQGTNIASIEETVDEQGSQISIVVQNDEVQAGVIVSAINGDSSAIIHANRVQISGSTTFANWLDTTAGVTTINGGHITAETIALNAIKCTGTLLAVKDATGANIYGYIGCGTGHDGSSTTTGVCIIGDSNSASATHYIMPTDAGVRMQSNTNKFYITDTYTVLGTSAYGALADRPVGTEGAIYFVIS